MVFGLVDNAFARAHVVDATVANVGDETSAFVERHESECRGHAFVFGRGFFFEGRKCEIERFLEIANGELFRPVGIGKRLSESITHRAACHFSLVAASHAVANHKERFRAFRLVTVGIAGIFLIAALPELRKRIWLV